MVKDLDKEGHIFQSFLEMLLFEECDDEVITRRIKEEYSMYHNDS